jgi:hypothetical protein
MALTKRTRVREVLIVFQDDLTVAAHQVPITEILDGGKVVSAVYGAAEALSVDDLGAVLDPAFILLANERDAALTAKKTTEETLARVERELNEALAAKKD